MKNHLFYYLFNKRMSTYKNLKQTWAYDIKVNIKFSYESVD